MIKYIIYCSMNIRVLPLYLSCGSLHQQLHYSSNRTRNPYDVLGLKSTCSVKEVKEAYIKLCKELHPDMKPGDVSQHKKFVELNDAYTTLLSSKYKKKDIRRRASSNTSNYSNIWRSSNYRENESQEHWSSEKSWYEEEEYQKYYQQHSKDNLMKKNIREANVWVIAGCFILMIVGSLLYLSAYRYATNYTKQTVDEKSKRISESYLGLRQTVVNKGTTEQLDGLKKKWSD